MINLNDKKFSEVTKEDILEKYSEYDIFKHYIGDFELGQTYKSPLRRDDDTPSFNVFHSRRYGCLLFKDFAGRRGDCVRFVQALLGLGTYQEALQQIAQDMPLNHSISVQPTQQLSLSKIECDLKIVARDWQDRDFAYWLLYGITLPTLKRYNVVPISGYYHNNHWVFTKDIAYAYLEYKDKVLTYKIYRPTAIKTKKWRNNNPYGVHQGYRQLPASNGLLIITKSLKDVMSIWENTNFPSIGVQSETCFIKETVVDEYKFRFDRVVTLFDNDRQGNEQAQSYEKMYDIESLFIPDEFGCKDFSDLVKQVGKQDAVQILKKLL